ncbi:MAG TPA: hypothetical protein VJ770_06290 [Stellaceae bacterium]|nr:hypothetical protein [Stellaceae bacterium]
MTEEAVLSFVKGAIKSAWPLELLLLMQKQPETAWRVRELVRELRASTGAVEESLATLIAAGLVATRETGVYTYAPKTPALAELVAALVDLYSRKPITVMNAIFSSPNDKIRSFSDAFLLKK